jgi:ParB-like chromosome segregation protein Spo0J
VSGDPDVHPTYFEVVPRGKLKMNPQNPKLITDADVVKMMTYLQTFGFRDPVEARAEDGLVLAGHRRLMAADRLGLKLIPVNFHAGMSDAEATAYTIAHTRSEKDVEWNRALLSDQMAGLDEEFVAGLGFGEEEIARIFDLDRGAEEEAEDGDAEAGDGPTPLLIPGESWVIGPVTFNVFENLNKASLIAAEGLIQKISKMLKRKALLDGDEMQPFDAVMNERRAANAA